MDTCPSVFVTSTGTSSGKTIVSRALALHLRSEGHRVAALKPLETGCTPDAEDAIALAHAAGAPTLAADPAFYRATQPVSPYAATLLGEPAPAFSSLVNRIRTIASAHDRVIVEGAGGLLVPLDATRDMSDLAVALAFPLLLVAPNRLGVLSHVLAVYEAAMRRSLSVAALVLNEPDARPDPSSSTNAVVLRARLRCAVLSFPYCENDDAVLAAAAASSRLPECLGWSRDQLERRTS